MTARVSRIPRPFLATGLAATALASVMTVCTTTAMAALPMLSALV